MANVLKKENMVISIREYTDGQGQQKKVWKTIGEIVTWDDGQQSFEMWGPTGSTKGNVFAKQDDNQQAPQQHGYQQPQQQHPQQQQGGFQQAPAQQQPQGDYRNGSQSGYQQQTPLPSQALAQKRAQQASQQAPSAELDDSIPF